jgi:hypothetical protein
VPQLTWVSVTIVSMLRLRSLVNFGSHSNVTWDFYDVSLWSTIELGVGVMIACLPTIRLLLARSFPAILSQGSRRTEQYQYASDARHEISKHQQSKAGTMGRERLDSIGDTTHPGSMRSEESHGVFYEENDEVELVHGKGIELHIISKA